MSGQGPVGEGSDQERKLVSTPQPCNRCLSLAFNGLIRAETVMPLPGTAPPRAIEDVSDGAHSPPGSPICHDCQAAENLAKVTGLAAWVATEPGGPKHPFRPEGLGFVARRIVICNERQEQLRIPEGMRPHFGLVRAGIVRPSEGENALDDHHAWLDSVGVVLGEERRPMGGRSRNE